MRTTLRHSLAACIALSALMLTGTACTDHDDLRTPAGTQLLALGEVTVAGTDVATTRSAATTGSATRATQDPSTGFTDIRKTGFVDGDVLTLTLSNVPGSSTPVTVTATMGAGNTWTLNPAKVYYAPATTTLTAATYTPATQPGSEAAGTTPGIAYKDDLTAATHPLAADGTKLSLTLTHANAMLEVTPPAGLTTYTDLTISATTPTGGSGSNTPQDLGYFTQGSTGNGDLRLLTIAPAGATAPTISLKVNGITYTTTLTLSVEANKRYPITLSIVGDDLIATLATPTLNWGTNTDFEGIPTGYTHYIRTADDLAQLATDVNAATPADTKTWTALQMADIDLSGIDNWTPIGKTNHFFMGSYNGNGHTVSGMKINTTTVVHVGLFGYIKEANITGVHVRNCSIRSTGIQDTRAGALIGFIDIGSVITLCSATGSVEASGATGFQIGGLIGRIYNESSTKTYVSRCSANVDVKMSPTANGSHCSAFTGCAMSTYFAGCIASGKVTRVGAYGTYSGFSNFNTSDAGKSGSNHYYCITNSDLTNAGASRTAFGVVVNIRSCLATWTGYTHFYTTATGGISTNVCLAQIIDQTDVSDGIAADAAHAILVSNKIDAGITTLHYSPEDGYTLTPVTRVWSSADIWQDNPGALPTLDMTYEGKAP